MNPTVPYYVIAATFYRIVFMTIHQRFLKEVPIGPDKNYNDDDLDKLYIDCIHKVGEFLIRPERQTVYYLATSGFQKLKKKFRCPVMSQTWISYIANAILPTPLIVDNYGILDVVAAAILCVTFMIFDTLTPDVYKVSVSRIFVFQSNSIQFNSIQFSWCLWTHFC